MTGRSGLDQTQEYEMRDRTTLLMPATQTDLITQAASAAAAKGKPFVVVLISGGVLDISGLLVRHLRGPASQLSLHISF